MKLNNGDVKRIVELHRGGMKCPAIAVIFGVSKATVFHLISRYRKKGFDAIRRRRKRPRYPRELIDKALEEVRRGGLISEVADRNGVSACLLSYWVRKETSIRYNPSRGEERKDDCRAKKGALGSEETRGPIGAGASKEPGADRSLKKTGCLSSKPTKEERQKIALAVQGLRQKSTRVTVKALLAKVDMPKATYYDSLKRIAKNKSRDAELTAAIRDIVEKSRYTYGSPRVSMELDKRGLHMGHNKVARLMRENHLNAKKKRAKYRSYRGRYGQVCGNLLLKERKIPGSKKKVVSRRFRAKAPNRIWVTDVTEFKTEEGKIYLAPIMDLFN